MTVQPCIAGRTTRRFSPRVAALATVAVLAVTGACEDPVLPPPKPASIMLSPTTVKLTAVAETAQISAVVVDEDGDTLSGNAIDWVSGDTLVATVSQTGLVRAEGHGATRITATAGSVSASATVTVDLERGALAALYEATGGEDWFDKEGWLSDDPISDWYGISTNADGRVVTLNLFFNGLSGSLPPEIGNLAHLRGLNLSFNGLSGSIPPEIGDLTQLRELYLDYNHLGGSIPPEIGSLAQLHALHLSLNRLSGSLPPEIGNLTELRELWLMENDLSGSIPPELGDLSDLEELILSNNGFTGSIPAELGSLANLADLVAHDNSLSGEIPPELGNLSKLRQLWLGGNNLTGSFPVELTRLANLVSLRLLNLPLTGSLPGGIGDMVSLSSLVLTYSGLSGLLPPEMTQLKKLSELMLGGTDLCAPDDDDFQAWIEGIPRRRVPSCRSPGGWSSAYLTQAVQSMEYPVPLVAGEEALLRVFVVAPDAEGDTIPLVRATFYLNGEEEVVEIEPGSSLVGKEINEGSLDASANVMVPRSVIQPGLEMVVQIDPDGTTDPELGVRRRIPETGRQPVEVRTMPDLEFTLIPFLYESDPDSAILDITDDLSTDDELLWPINELLPVGDIDLEIHDAVVSSSNSSSSLLDQTGAIRAAEGGTGYFMGTMSGEVTGALGVAYMPGWTSFSIPDSTIMAHELGHNLRLEHAPCGGAGGPDPSFPQSDGTIGAWGYDVVSGKLVDPSIHDLMSYCDPNWISEYHFTNSLRHRLDVETEEYLVPQAAPTRSLLIWGGADADEVPRLEPVFVIDARPSLPPSGGAYRLIGASADDTELFKLHFDMPSVADAEGRGSFAFTLPVQAGWADDLARITLSGPGGSVTLDTGSDRPAAIVRDPRTGQVRGIFTNMLVGATAADVLASHDFEPGLEVFFSRGVPDATAWRR